jgi:hypothetical protein
VHHLDEVAGPVRAHPRTARLAVDVGGDRLEQRAQRGVRLLGATRHDRRALEGADLAAGDAGAHEVQTLLPKRLLTSTGVLEVGVAAVDDDVALLEQRDELVDDRVGARAGLDHDDDAPRSLQ